MKISKKSNPSPSDPDFESFFQGLKALEASLYPKSCSKCGNIYSSAEDFFLKTNNKKLHGQKSGLKMTQDDNGTVIIEAFRNCICGSTLLCNFGDRRDNSEQGKKRRAEFETLLNYLINQGIDRESARQQLLGLIKSDKSINFHPTTQADNQPEQSNNIQPIS